MKVVRLLSATYRGAGVMGEWLGPPHEEIPRCGARKRSSGSCGQYAMKNGRCRYHGGKSTGAKNPHRPIKHGLYTKDAILERRAISQLLKDARNGIKEVLG